LPLLELIQLPVAEHVVDLPLKSATANTA